MALFSIVKWPCFHLTKTVTISARRERETSVRTVISELRQVYEESPGRSQKITSKYNMEKPVLWTGSNQCTESSRV